MLNYIISDKHASLHIAYVIKSLSFLLQHFFASHAASGFFKKSQLTLQKNKYF